MMQSICRAARPKGVRVGVTSGPDPPIVSPEAGLAADELGRRPARPPDHAAENRALGALAEAMAADPPTTLQKLVDTALDLCRADSTGVSLSDPDGNFRWPAVAGAWVQPTDDSAPRDASPCAVVLARDAAALFTDPVRSFPGLATLTPPPAELLLVPFHAGGRPVGTVWAIAHSPAPRFDAEDLRLLTSLSRFAGAAHQTVAARDELGVRVREQTKELTDASAARRESEALYRTLVANLPGGAAFVVGPDLVYRLVGGQGLRDAGFVPADLEGKTLWEALGPELADEYEPIYRGALAGRPFEQEHAAHGRHFRTHGIPLRTAAGDVDAVLAVSYDITDRVRAEAGRRESEERFRLVVESATDYAIFTLDPDRRVRTWNPGAAAIFGYAEAEILGRSGDILFTPEDRARGAPEDEVRAAVATGRAADERWHIRKDESRFYASGVLFPLRDADAPGFVKIARDLTERRRAEEALQQAHDELEARVAVRTAALERLNEALTAEVRERERAEADRSDLLRRLATAQEAERRRVARDLHDQTGQLLAALALAIRAVETSGGLPAAAAGRLGEVRRVADELGRQVHGLAVRLRPTALDDLGLRATLQTELTGWAARTGVTTDFQTVGLDDRRFPPEVETTLYRVVQEALTNVVKHARARTVSVVVEWVGGHGVAVVEDDGAGFDPAAVPPGRLGLAGMRERVTLAGGTLDLEMGPAGGTTLIARIPVAGGHDHE